MRASLGFGHGPISSLLRASATLLFSPLMYCKSGEYFLIYNLHCMTLSELNFFWIQVSWSAYTLICFTRSIFLNSFRTSTMESNSLSVIVYLLCAGLNFLL